MGGDMRLRARSLVVRCPTDPREEVGHMRHVLLRSDEEHRVIARPRVVVRDKGIEQPRVLVQHVRSEQMHREEYARVTARVSSLANPMYSY